MTDLPHPTLIELAAILAEANDRDHCLENENQQSVG